MYADTLEELHFMASAIGMKFAWFQNKAGFPHYDLVSARRRQAVLRGAIETDRRHMVNHARAKRGLPPLPVLEVAND
jgi:hypothetical protein